MKEIWRKNSEDKMQEDKEEQNWNEDVEVKPFNWTLAVLVIIIIAALTTTLIILQQNQTDTTNDTSLLTESVDAGAEPQGEATSQVTINILPADNAGEETE